MHDKIHPKKRPADHLQSNEVSSPNISGRTTSATVSGESQTFSSKVSQNSPRNSEAPMATSSKEDKPKHVDIENCSNLNGAFCADEFTHTTNMGKSCLVVEIFAGSCRLSKAHEKPAKTLDSELQQWTRSKVVQITSMFINTILVISCN